MQREFATGDRVQFTRNDRIAGRVNGATTTVVGIDAEKRTLAAVDARGREHTLSLDSTGNRDVRHGWVATVHGSQDATADRSMTHLGSFTTLATGMFGTTGSALCGAANSPLICWLAQ